MTVFPVLASRRSLLGGLAPAAAGMSGLLRPQYAAGGIPAVALFVALDVLAEGRSGLQCLLRLLAERASLAADTTFALAAGGSLFDRRFGLERLRPSHLVFDETDRDGSRSWHGDLLLRIEAEAQEPAVAALRDVAVQTHHLLAPRWKVNGFRPPGSGTSRSAAVAPRRGGSYVEILKVRHAVERGEAGGSRDDPGAVPEIYAYDHGIDEAGQFDMGLISCRYLAQPAGRPDPAAGASGRCCGGGLFHALPGERGPSGLGRALLQAIDVTRTVGSR